MALTASLQRVVAALRDHGDMDVEALSEAACVARTTLQDGGYMRQLMALGLVRVARWVRATRGAPSPVYSVLPGKSAPRPKAYTVGDKCRRWRQRVGYRSPEWRRAQSLKALAEVFR